MLVLCLARFFKHLLLNFTHLELVHHKKMKISWRVVGDLEYLANEEYYHVFNGVIFDFIALFDLIKIKIWY